MVDFNLHEQFDAVTCLFSSIGYVQTVHCMRRAIACMASHLKLGGVLIVEPWFAPDQYQDGFIQVNSVDIEGAKAVRMMRAGRDGDNSILDTHYLVGHPHCITHFTERHVLGLFHLAEYIDAFETAGLRPVLEEWGLTGRGLIIGSHR